jgi:hypothetical protein
LLAAIHYQHIATQYVHNRKAPSHSAILTISVNPASTDISKMYCSLWEPPEVSERMWSVYLNASISGEYQTGGGHSGWPSEYNGSDCDKCRNISERRRGLWVKLGAPGSTVERSGSAGDKFGGANDKPRSTAYMSGSTSNHSSAV